MHSAVGRDGNPAVSVVLCVHNGAATVDTQLAALSLQDFDGPWDVVVVDNASTDGTREIVAAWVKRMSCLRVVSEPQVGLNRARNRGVRAATGRRIVLCDADDEVAPGWLGAMVGGLDRFDIVGGALEPPPNPASHWPPVECPQQHGLATMLGLPFAMGASLGFTRRVFDIVDGFDADFVRGADEVDFCLRAQHAGCSIGFVADAVAQYRPKESARGVVRQWYGRGAGYQRLVEKHAACGWISSSVATRWRDVVKSGALLVPHLPDGLRRASRFVYLARAAHIAGEAAELARGLRPRARVGAAA